MDGGPEAVDHLKVARCIVDALRTGFDLPYEQCKSTAFLVASAARVAYGVDQLQPLCDALQTATVDFDQCSDVGRYEHCLRGLSEAVEDGQQRSWHLYDDEREILDNLETLTSLIEKAEPSVSRRALKSDDYAHVERLIRLYQMETRPSIRKALVQFYQAASELDYDLASYFLNSVLPVAVASALVPLPTSKEIKAADLRLLATLFSTGEPIPYSHYSCLNETFLAEMIDLYANREETAGDLALLALANVVAFNLHYPPDAEDNKVLAALMANNAREVFMERLLVIFNSAENLLQRCTGTSWTDGSAIVKLLTDVAHSGMLQSVCYPSDVQQFFEILCRELTDRQPGKIRTAYLKLLSESINVVVNLKNDSPYSWVLVNSTVNSIGFESDEDLAIKETIIRAMSS